jgi:hypothetical protein
MPLAHKACEEPSSAPVEMAHEVPVRAPAHPQVGGDMSFFLQGWTDQHIRVEVRLQMMMTPDDSLCSTTAAVNAACLSTASEQSHASTVSHMHSVSMYVAHWRLHPTGPVLPLTARHGSCASLFYQRSAHPGRRMYAVVVS